jgi:hypothetical protein
VTLIPMFLLPKRKVEAPVDGEQPASAAMMH